MKPPDGVTIRHLGTSNGHVHYEVTVEEVVHPCPPMGASVTPCCGRTPFELPRFDRITLDPDLVTCIASGDVEQRCDGCGWRVAGDGFCHNPACDARSGGGSDG